jgi:hypothetical protein
MAEIRYNENGSVTLSFNGKQETFEQVSKLVNYLRDNNLEISLNETKTIDRQLFEDFDLREYLVSINKIPTVVAAETNITLPTIEKILNKEDVNMLQFREVIQYLNLEMFFVKDGEAIKFTPHHKWGEFLTRTRRKKKLSLKDIANQVGCTSVVVGSLEMKRLPRLQTFCKILDVLDIELYIQSK